MSAREDLYASIRRSLHVGADDAPRRGAVAARLAASPRGVRVERGQGDEARRVEVFTAEATRAQASVVQVADARDVPAEAARFLRDNNLSATLRMGADPRLAAMPWSQTALDLSHGVSDGHDLNGIVCAFGAVAETGTLALTSGAENPTTLNFLPDNALAVVFAADVEADAEGVFARLRARYGGGLMPRTLNFITGPSRTADLEQTLLLGAHGPRRLHVIVVKSAAAGG